jgi:maltooligosyltrehalose trehalohydrolase
MLFMGEEYGEENPFQYFISHTDEELVSMVREGRKKEFSYFKWQGEVPDPQSENTFQKCILSWDLQSATRKKLFNFYRYLIAFRKTKAAMKGTSRENVQVLQAEQQKLISLVRSFENDTIVILLNFDDATVPYTPEKNVVSARKLFDSSALEWQGPGEICPEILTAGKQVLIHPHSVLIFQL